MNEQIILNWTELHHIYDVTYDDIKLRGVYCWGFNINNKFIPYYIGIAENIISRIYDHVNSIIGGRYTIFHKDSLHLFTRYKMQNADMESQGRIFLPNWPYGYQNFLIARKKLAPHIDHMVDTFTFTYAVVDEKYNSHDLKCIEKICIASIGLENLINTRCGSSRRFEIEHYGKSLIVEKFRKSSNYIQ